jgi:hypothetical protein
MRFARVRSPQENDVRLLDFAVGARSSTRPECRRQTDDARCVSCPVATVDVVGAEGDSCQLLRQKVHFVRGLRAAEDAKCVRATCVEVAPEAAGRAIERFIPAGSAKRAVLTDQRPGQTRVGTGRSSVVLHSGSVLLSNRGRAWTTSNCRCRPAVADWQLRPAPHHPRHWFRTVAACPRRRSGQ